jgi:rhamnosyltransferase
VLSVITPHGYSEVRTCITSGALTNLDLWKKLDGFDEQMFIDSVDFEYCYRVRKAGYKVIQTDQVQLSHSIGNAIYVQISILEIQEYRA